jgi:DNA-binding MarR family transcriptional regulator
VHPKLTGVGLLMLQLIQRKGPITAARLGQILTMDKSAVSRQIADLRQHDLVACAPSESDRRELLLTASPAAQEALRGFEATAAGAFGAGLLDWPAADLTTLRDLLHRFNQDTAPAA